MALKRFAVATTAFVLSSCVWYQFMPSTPFSSISLDDGKRLLSSKTGLGNWKSPGTHSAQVQLFFDQIFSVSQPASYNFPALQQSCAQAPWPPEGEEVYMRCGGMAAGMTSIISQVKVCLKMAVDTGSSLILPAMPLRDSTDLTDFNFFNPDAYMTYDEWFDVDHLVSNMAKACPKMKIIHPDQLDTSITVKHTWNVEIGDAPGYHFPDNYFWVGRPFKTFFQEQFAKRKAEFEASTEGKEEEKKKKEGITVITIGSPFLLFRITDDPTRQDLALWNDLTLLVRFKEQPRQIIDRVLSHMDRPFYGVHFRVEKDNIWSPLDVQLAADLDSLDAAWAKFGKPGVQKPLVYLACGDPEQVKIFEAAGKERGWEVVHKWAVLEGDEETLRMIKELAFDFQGAVDFGVMVKSEFYIGITGSAFSGTLANARDVTGRYRGSSFDVYDDEGARSHLNTDGAASSYPCCL